MQWTNNPTFASSTKQSLRTKLDIREAARKELNRITSESLTSLRSNFKSADELEETIKKLEKQITTTPSNKTRLVGARKRVSNMRTPLARGGGFRRAGLIAMAATKKNNNGLESHPLEPNAVKTRGFGSVKKREKTPAANVNLGSFFESAESEKAAKNLTAGANASIIKKNKNTESIRARERADFNKKKYQKMIENGETISASDRKRIELLYNNLAKELNKRNAVNKAKKEANEKAAAEKKTANNAKAAAEKKAANNAKAAAEKKAANNAKAAAEKKAANNVKKAVIAEKNARNALNKYLLATVKPRYNKALVNAILKLPNLNNNTRRRLQAPRMYAIQRGAGVFRNRAAKVGGVLGRGAVTAGGALGRGAVTAGGALGRGAVTAGGFFSRSAAPAAAVPAGRGVGGFFSSFFARKPVGPPSFIPSEEAGEIPFGYVFKKNKQGTGYYLNNNKKARASQIEHRGYGPAPKPTGTTTTGVSIGVGPGPRNRYENNYGYGNNRGYGPAPKPTGTNTTGVSIGVGPGPRNRYGNNRGGPGGPWGPGGGIVFKPQITVGAARIGAQTFGGTRVGGQQMGGSRLRGGNTGSTTLKTGNTQVSNVGKLSNAGKVSTSNAGRLAVSAPTSSGNRQLAATSEQLIRGAGGAEAVEQGIKALKAANGNVNRAKAASRLPNKTFTNIYAMGGPVAAKRLVQIRRRRRTVGGRRVGTGTRGAPWKKKRVAPKPRKQYIKLTPYQFRRLTDHIKKNNLRKVLIKEITH